MTEWIECTLDKLGEIVGGATPSTKCEDYYGGSIPWITPKDLSSFKGRYITSGERNITEKGLASCSAQMMPKDAVLFTSRAPIGYVAIASQSVCTNQGFKSIVVNEKADPLFVYYLLKYNKDAIEAMGSGTTFKEVSGKTMRAVKVRIPLDVSYQKRIAAVLDSLDTKIENNERINDNIAFFTPKDVGIPYTLITEKTISKEGLSHCNSRLYPVNTVFVTARGTVGKVGMSGVPMAMNQSCYALVGKETHQLLVYFYTLKAVDRLKHKASGAVFDAITTRDFESEQIMKLSDDDATAFLRVAEPMFQEVLNNNIENLRLSTLRDSLLPKLMSGEIDVSAVQL